MHSNMRGIFAFDSAVGVVAICIFLPQLLICQHFTGMIPNHDEGGCALEND
jgi:hypothetical protein